MRVRLAALITVCAAALLWFGPSPETEDPAGICVSTKAPRSDVIAACSNLINAQITTSEYRHLFLTERAWAHRRNGSFKRAVADVDHALALQPENFKTWLLRARIHEASGDLTVAEANYDSAVRFDPTTVNGMWDKAAFFKRQGKYDAALNLYTKILKIDPSFHDAADQEAAILAAGGDVDLALERLNSAKMNWPDEHWVYDRLVQLHVVFTGDLEKAIDASTRLASLRPSIMHEFLIPGIVHLRIGDEQTGVELIEEYGVEFLKDSMNKLEGWDYLTRVTSQWVVVGGLEVEAGIYKGIGYSFSGRSDLAKKEFKLFLERTGSWGEKLLISVMNLQNVKADAKKFSKSDAYVDDILTRYAAVLHSKSGFPFKPEETASQ